MSDLDRLHAAWARLDTGAPPARPATPTLRRRMAPLAFGQGAQILLGVALAALGGSVRLGATHAWVDAAATAIAVYGVAAIAWALATLALLARVDFGDPVAVVQRRVLALQRAHLLGSLVLGLAWWVLWIPLMLVLFAWAGGDYLAHVGPALPTIAVACAVGLVASIAVGAVAWRRPAGRRVLRRTLLGERLHAVGEALDALEP